MEVNKRINEMKKFFGLLLMVSASSVFLWLANPSQSLAQDYYGSSYHYKRVSMGITLSPNVSWLRYGDNDSYDGRSGLGFAYGLLTDFAVADNYYFSTGLVINSLSTEAAHFNPEIGTTKAQHRLQFVEIPLAAKLKSVQRYNRSYYGKFGFTVGARVSGKERLNDASKRTKIDGADIFRLGLQIGGGVEWQLDHNLNLMTGLTFNNGFTRAKKAGGPKNSYVSLDFGIFF